jgi:hypothetical protein
MKHWHTPGLTAIQANGIPADPSLQAIRLRIVGPGGSKTATGPGHNLHFMLSQL